MSVRARARDVRLVCIVVAALAVGACAKNASEGALSGSLAGSGVGGGAGAGAATPGSRQDFSVNVGDRVYFETDSTDLTATAQNTLDRQATWLNQYAHYTFTVSGHADERGTREYNFALGARRADVVKNYLASRGVSAGRIRTISYGKERPVATCNDISCWSQNRRAITVLGGGES